jgi:hypothetical protein
VAADTHTIILTSTTQIKNRSWTMRYAIEWKYVSGGSGSGSGVTENEFYVIDSLDACVT